MMRASWKSKSLWFVVALSLTSAACDRDRPAPPSRPTQPMRPAQNEIPADASIRLITDPVPANPPDGSNVQVR